MTASFELDMKEHFKEAPNLHFDQSILETFNWGKFCVALVFSLTRS